MYIYLILIHLTSKLISIILKWIFQGVELFYPALLKYELYKINYPHVKDILQYIWINLHTHATTINIKIEHFIMPQCSSLPFKQLLSPLTWPRQKLICFYSLYFFPALNFISSKLNFTVSSPLFSKIYLRWIHGVACIDSLFLFTVE